MIKENINKIKEELNINIENEKKENMEEEKEFNQNIDKKNNLGENKKYSNKLLNSQNNIKITPKNSGEIENSQKYIKQKSNRDLNKYKKESKASGPNFKPISGENLDSNDMNKEIKKNKNELIQNNK